MRKIMGAFLLTGGIFISLISQSVAANVHEIKLNSADWLGSMKLDSKKLSSIKAAVEKALVSNVDEEEQCGEVQLDCVVRAAREWTVDGDKYREIVINIHTVGHVSHTVGQVKGHWPAVNIK